MRVLLDEHFPDPPGFDPSHLDANLHVVSLRQHDKSLVGRRTPDWYLYLVAHESGFDALVTRDWRQSAQTEEMWVATRTRVSIITWRKGQNDPVVEWAQLLMYMPQLRTLLAAVGPSVFLLPSPVLTAAGHVLKASDQLAVFAQQQGRARQELVHEARANAKAWLEKRNLVDRHATTLGL